MKQMKAIITILTLLSTQSESLPVTSKALDNSSDQLIWQTAWYSHHLNEGKREDDSPFHGDSRKITAKSIFITPNFSLNTSHCPPDHKVDDNGKCIKVVSINQDDLLVTRLQSFFSQHETTDDTTNIDYDYSLEDEESREPTHFTLPLVPILNDNESSLSATNEPASSSTVQYEIELNEYSFRQPNSSDSPSTVPPTVVIDLLKQQPETDGERSELMNSTSIDLSTKEDNEDRSSDEPDKNSNAPHRSEDDEKNINSSENDTTTAESLASLEQTDTESPESTSPDSRDISDSDGDDNYSTTTPRDFVVINKSESFDEQRAEAEKTISNRSDTTAIHLDDYFDTILLNDSLLIDGTSSYENATDFDYDATTITAFSPAALSDSEESTNGSSESTTEVDRVITSTTDESQLFPSTTTTTASPRQQEEDATPQDNDFPYENRIIKDDQQDSDSENLEQTNKFVYHHVPAKSFASNEDVLATTTTTTVVRFPADEAARGQRVRFPDDAPKTTTTSSFAWPRDSGFQQPGGVMRFWQEQPLINDYKFFSRGNSRAPSGNFNRPMSYRRNYR